MKTIFSRLMYMALLFSLFSACEKDMEKSLLISPSALSGFKSNTQTLILSEETDARNVVSFEFKAPEYGVSVVRSYSLQFDLPADTSGQNAWGKAVTIKLALDSTRKTLTGKELNSMLVNQLAMPAGTAGKVAVRLKAEVNQSTGAAATVAPMYSTLVLTVTPYEAIVIYPALVVKGGNSWITPAVEERANGYLLTSSGFNSKYEGYLYLPNADGWGGDGFTLISSADQKQYGWGSSATTLALGNGNLWLTPAPNYMKVTADLDAMTISYTPVQFFLTGDFNGWSTSATPMAYDPATKKLSVSNVSLSSGGSLVFIANGSYDISYKVDADGKLVFAGPPSWGGNNIQVPSNGVYTVVLDLSGGAGSYTYSLIKQG